MVFLQVFIRVLYSGLAVIECAGGHCLGSALILSAIPLGRFYCPRKIVFTYRSSAALVAAIVALGQWVVNVLVHNQETPRKLVMDEYSLGLPHRDPGTLNLQFLSKTQVILTLIDFRSFCEESFPEHIHSHLS